MFCLSCHGKAAKNSINHCGLINLDYSITSGLVKI